MVRNAHRSQIVVKPVTHFDHESGKVYRFELGATDSHGERTTAEIIVEVTDVNEAPSEPVELMSDFAVSGMASVIVPEVISPEGSLAVGTYEAVRPAAGTTVTWKLEGADKDDLTISSGGGVTSHKRLN